MTKKYTKLLMGLMMLIGLSVTFTACDDDDWNPLPPGNWDNIYYDTMLTGTWELYQANGVTLRPYERNYLEFYGRGRGRYYYYNNGELYWEQMAYWCDDLYGNGYHPMLCLKYENTPALTTSYWFTDGGYSLWLQWEEYGRTTTYLYRAIDQIP